MYLVFDLETTIQEKHKRTANPWFNSIVATGYKNGNISKTLVSKDVELICGNFPSSIRTLVGHNIKFDLLYLWKSERLQYMLQEGLTIWDTQLAEYYLTAQQHKYAALRDIAVNKYGRPERSKLMEDYWKQGICTSEIPIELVLQDVTEDVIDTEAIYLQQVDRAKKMGMFSILTLKMEALLATVEMEYNGMYVNQQVLEENEDELALKIQQLEENLHDMITPHWIDEEINLASATQLSWLLFGGKTTKKVREPVVDSKGNTTIVKSGPNKGTIKLGMYSKDVHIKGLGIKPLPAWKGSKEGQYSTKEEVLEIIALGDPNHTAVKVVNQLLKLRKLTRELNTNYTGFRELIYADESRVHPSFSHCGYGERDAAGSGGTETGRLSCSNPNVQNAPKSNISTVRKYFVSRYNNGILLEGDFSQIEPIVQAQISRDPQYIKDMIEGIDTHVKRLAMKERMDYNHVFKLCKVDKDLEWVDKRSKIKEFSFQRTYGAGATKIAINTGLSVDEVKDMIKNEDLDYKVLKQYNNMLLDQVKQTAVYIDRVTIKGHKVRQGWYNNPFGSRYSFLTDDAPEWLAETTSFKPTKVKNYIVQGTAFDMLAIYLGLVFRAAIKHRDKFLLINTVHDSVVLDCKKEHQEFACNLLKNEVNSIKDVLKRDFNYNWTIPLKMEFKTGDSWYDCGV